MSDVSLDRMVVVGRLKKSTKKTVLLPPKEIKKKSFMQILPTIIAFWMSDLTRTEKEIFRRYKHKIDGQPMSFKEFQLSMRQAGVTKKMLRAANNPKEQSKVIADSVSKLKAERAESHQRMMIGYLDKAHKVVGKIEPQEESIDQYLGTITNLNKVARETLDIKPEVSADSRNTNLALLIHLKHDDADYEPEPKTVEGTVIN